MTTNTAQAIIQAAYEDACLCPVGSPVSVGQLSRGLDRLVDLINLWATQGLKLWLQQTITVPLVEGQGTYSFGPGGDVNMVKPLSLLQGTYVYTTGARQPLTVMSLQEYINLSQLNVNGSINSYMTKKDLTYTYVSFYNPPDAQAASLGEVQMLARVQSVTPLVTADALEFSPEWFIALRWGLADEVCTGQSEAIQNRCTLRAEAFRQALEGFDVEDAPTFFTPDPRVQQFNSSFR